VVHGYGLRAAALFKASAGEVLRDNRAQSESGGHAQKTR